MEKMINRLNILLDNIQVLEAIEKFIINIENFKKEMEKHGLNNNVVKHVLQERLVLAKKDKNVQIMVITELIEEINKYEEENKYIIDDLSRKLYKKLTIEIEEYLQKMEG